MFTVTDKNLQVRVFTSWTEAIEHADQVDGILTVGRPSADDGHDARMDAYRVGGGQ